MAVLERVAVDGLAQGAVPPGYTFTRSTAATYIDSDGLLKSAAINTPRRQWDATNRRWGYVGEGSRTNLLLWSQEFDNASWVYSAVGITANATTAPDGTLTADKLVGTNTSTTHEARQSITSAAVAYSMSCFFKAAEYSFGYLNYHDGTLDRQAFFNLGTGAVGTVSAGATASIVSVGGGWYRCTMVVTGVVGLNRWDFGSATADNARIGLHDGTSGIYIWGAQLEAGPAPSSYIPTTTSTMSRGADLLTRALTGPEGTALSTQGTMVVEFSLLGGNPASGATSRFISSIDGGSSANRILAYNDTSNVALNVIRASANQGTSTVSGGPVAGVVKRVAKTWSGTRFVIAADGVVGGVVSTPTIPTVTAIGIAAPSFGTNELFGLIYGWTIYDDAKTDAELQALTTPTTNRNQSRLTLGLGLGL